MEDTWFLITLKIIISIIFFLLSFAMIYACTKAKALEEKLAHARKLITEDLAKIYQTASTAGKFIIELVLARYSIDLSKFL